MCTFVAPNPPKRPNGQPLNDQTVNPLNDQTTNPLNDQYMKQGKKICKTLKEIRLQVARANDIPYEPTECNHKGDCLGTCPKCEEEVRYIEP